MVLERSFFTFQYSQHLMYFLIWFSFSTWIWNMKLSMFKPNVKHKCEAQRALQIGDIFFRNFNFFRLFSFELFYCISGHSGAKHSFKNICLESILPFTSKNVPKYKFRNFLWQRQSVARALLTLPWITRHLTASCGNIFNALKVGGFKHLFKKLYSTLRYSSFPFAHHFERSFLFIEPAEPSECILFHCKCFLFLLWLVKLFSHSLQFHFQKNFRVVKTHFISCTDAFKAYQFSVITVQKLAKPDKLPKIVRFLWCIMITIHFCLSNT